MLTLLLVSLAAAPPAPIEVKKVAVPTFKAVNLTAEEGDFFSEHFSQQLQLSGPRVKVTSAAQIQTVLGFERQKQLLGCEDTSACMAELANALGADVVLTGSVGQFGDTHQINVKALSPVSAEALALVSGSVRRKEDVLPALTRLAQELYGKLTGIRARTATTNLVEPVAPQRASSSSGVGGGATWVGPALIAGGGVLALIGVAGIATAEGDEDTIVGGVVIAGLGAAVAGVGLVSLYSTPSGAQAQLGVGPTSVRLSGTF